MSAPYIVIEFPDGQRVAQEVRLGTTLQDLEDLWDGAWQDCCRPQSEQIRVGLGKGSLWVPPGSGNRSRRISDAVSKLNTTWLGYRDAVPRTRGAKDTEPEPKSEPVSEPVVEGSGANVDMGMSERMVAVAKEINLAHLEVQNLDSTATRARSRARSTASEAKQARIRVGKMLLEVRREHGGPERGPGAKWWGDFVMRTGIAPRTARKYMAEAERAEVSARGRNPEPPIDAAAKFKASVRKLVKKWPADRAEDVPTLLRDLADEIERESSEQADAAAEGGGQ